MEKKVNSKDFEIDWDEEKGTYKLKSKENKKRGKVSRARGARFELKVREEMKKTGYILDKWTNNIDLVKQEIVPAKRKYNPFKKMLVVGTGFPDFIGIKHIAYDKYDVIGIEVKTNGFLSQEEKIKCKFYLQNKIFSKIFIAKEIKEARKINVELLDFEEKYKNKYDKL